MVDEYNQAVFHIIVDILFDIKTYIAQVR